MKSRVFATVYLISLLCHTAYAADVTPTPSSPNPSHQERGILEEGGKVAGKAIKIPDVVATVNGHNFTREDLERRMAQSRAMDPGRFDALDLEQRRKAIGRTISNMVVREVVYQEAIKRKIVVTDKEVDLRLEDLKRQFPSEEALNKAFADANISIPAWKSETRKSLMATKLEDLMVDELKISNNEIADYFEKNKKGLTKDDRETLEDHREHIKAILQRIKWQKERSVWLSRLMNNAKVWKWSPEDSRQ